MIKYYLQSEILLSTKKKKKKQCETCENVNQVDQNAICMCEFMQLYLHTKDHLTRRSQSRQGKYKSVTTVIALDCTKLYLAITGYMPERTLRKIWINAVSCYKCKCNVNFPNLCKLFTGTIEHYLEKKVIFISG